MLRSATHPFPLLHLCLPQFLLRLVPHPSPGPRAGAGVDAGEVVVVGAVVGAVADAGVEDRSYTRTSRSRTWTTM